MEDFVDHMDGLAVSENGQEKGKQQVVEEEVGAGDDENVCAICLGPIALEDVAILPSCDHVYCAHCIIHWASLKEQGDACCPQCKAPFSEVVTYRNLDGALQDFPVQNSVCLLKRATWFKERAAMHTLPPSHEQSPGQEDSWADDDAYDACGGEDDDLEAFYFSSAAGRARVTLANRKFGEGGYITSGRRQARPKNNGSGKAKHVCKPSLAAQHSPVPVASAAMPVPVAKAAVRTSSAAAASPAGPHSWAGASPTLGSSPSGTGRRARRNARRAALDAIEAVLAA